MNNPIRLKPARRPLPRWIWAALRIGIVLLVAGALLFSWEHSALYHPRAYGERYKSGLARDAVELSFTAAAGKQTAFYFPRGHGGAMPVHLWVAFGGNATLALDWCWFLAQDRNPADAFLLVDYPGYGKSEGYAAIMSNRAVADGALKALAGHLHVVESDFAPHLCAIGHSLGAALALDFAARHSAQRIVLISPFTTLREEAATVAGRFLSYLLIENYDNRARVRELARRSPAPRVAIFHGTEDDIIPVRMGRELAEDSSGIATFHAIAEADHVNIFDKGRGQILDAMNQ
jgi:pimeloyl-ACP methyl ester carboxylesterase